MDKTSKIDEEQKRHDDEKIQKYSQPSTTWLGKCLQWLLTFFFSLLLSAVITWSKISVMVLSKQLADQVNKTKESTVILFAMLEIMILIPNIVTLFRSVAKCCFRGDIPSPTSGAYTLAFLVSLTESFGLTLFVFIWPRYITPSMCIALMGCITTPITTFYILDLGARVQFKTNKKCCSISCGFLRGLRCWPYFWICVKVILSAVVLAITVIIIVIPELENHNMIPGTGFGYFAITTCCLLFAWMPPVQRRLLDRKSRAPSTDNIEAQAGTTKLQAGSIHCSDNQAGTTNFQAGSIQCSDDQAGTTNFQAGSIQCSDNQAGTTNFQAGSIQCSDDQADTTDFQAGSIQCSDNQAGTIDFQAGSIQCSDDQADTIKSQASNTNEGRLGENKKESELHSSRNFRTYGIGETQTTWKLTLFMSFWKIVFVHLFSMLLFYFTPPDGLRKYDSAFKLSIWKRLDGRQLLFFSSNIICSLLGYILYFLANTIKIKTPWHAIPLCVSSLLACGLLLPEAYGNHLFLDTGTNIFTKTNLYSTLPAACCVTVLYGIYKVCKGKANVKERLILKEDQLFWVPTYNSVLLDQWLLLCERHPRTRDSTELQPDKKVPQPKKPTVFICTTMYRETKEEMKQLLKSFKALDSKEKKEYICEIHIFFDGACNDEGKRFVNQLISLVKDLFGKGYSRRDTECGYILIWKDKLKIHMKDNEKVKNRKRWSQVMYMTYLLDFRLKGKFEEDCYILTTDADVDFTPESIDSLLDMMKRDDNVGAVCARTHPLGSGPIVWYQIFEYAIGHWLQKTAEHVIGTVLCAPGCFSLYRCSALAEVLPTYSGEVENAFDFLTMDMGEDRWLCTLMVQSGRRIDYCAKADCRTYCPDTLEEFFKQRRRWIVSTLANQLLLLKHWNIIELTNKRLGNFFWLYEVITLVSTFVGPSSVILVVSGGLVYAWDVPTTWSAILQILLILIYAVVSLRASKNIQIIMAQFLTYLYSITMCAVIVGILIEVVQDFSGINTHVIDRQVRLSTSTLYLFIMVGLFLLTGIMHLWKECRYLLFGFCYFLAIPSGYLLLMVYSLCNITDRSWGTRESATGEDDSSCSGILQKLCTCTRLCVWRTRSQRERGEFVESQIDLEVNSADIQQSCHGKITVLSESKHGSPRSPSPQVSEPSQGPPTSPKLEELPAKEALFWKLLQQRIKSEGNRCTTDTDDMLKGKLVALRNTWLLLFSISNSLWVILIFTMASNAQLLEVAGSNPLGLVVLTIFLIVLTLQFLAMLRHRLSTFVHYIARKNRALDEWMTRKKETPNDSTTRKNETPDDSTTRQNETPGDSTTRKNETPDDSKTRKNETPGDSTTRKNETPDDSTTRQNETPDDSTTRKNETPDDSTTRQNETPDDSKTRKNETPGDSTTRKNETPDDSKTEKNETSDDSTIRKDETQDDSTFQDGVQQPHSQVS